MNKKPILLCIVLLFILSSMVNFVAAQEEGTSRILDVFEKMFGFIPKTLENLWGQDATAIFLARFLIWILLFSIIYFGVGKIGGIQQSKGIRISVSFVIAVLGSALIPTPILINIFMTYMVIGSVLVLAIPFIAGWFLISKIPAEGASNYVRAFIYILLMFVIGAMRQSMGFIIAQRGASMSAATVVSTLSTMNSFFALFEIVALFGVISSLMRGFGGKGAKESIASGLSGKGGIADDFSKWLGGEEKEEAALTTKAEKELTDAEKKIETAVEGAPKKVKKQAKAIQDNLENVKTSIEFINIEKKKLDKALQAATTIKKELESDEEAAQYLERTERFHAVESERIANEIIAHDDAITKYLKLIEEKILILRKKLDISHSYLLKVVKEVDAVKDTVKKLREDVVKEVRKSMELRATTHKIKIKYKGKQ